MTVAMCRRAVHDAAVTFIDSQIKLLLSAQFHFHREVPGFVTIRVADRAGLGSKQHGTAPLAEPHLREVWLLDGQSSPEVILG